MFDFCLPIRSRTEGFVRRGPRLHSGASAKEEAVVVVINPRFCWLVEPLELLPDGGLTAPTENTAALHLMTGENFDVDAVIDSSGTGGMFFLVGWTGHSGYLVNQITLKSSEVWLIYEYQSQHAKFVEFKRVPNVRWGEGYKPVSLNVQDKKLTMKVGDGFVVNELELPGYLPGHVVLGTSATSYGAKPLKIRSMRLRRTLIGTSAHARPDWDAKRGWRGRSLLSPCGATWPRGS